MLNKSRIVFISAIGLLSFVLLINSVYAYQASETVPVYRFWNTENGDHFYTISEIERDKIMANSDSYTYEGKAFYVYASQTQETVPVYRFWNTENGDHFYTISELEKDKIIANYNSYTYEGKAFYVYAEEQCISETEICDGFDNDCDGLIDEEGVCDVCIPYNEVCDGFDNDCDGLIDEEGVCGTPLCYTNSDCGTPQCAGEPNYCLNGNVYQDFLIPTCNNPGQINSYCSNFIFPQLLETCECGCYNGGCSSCPSPILCGNGILENGEECDDGNNVNNDGCSSACEIESEPPECCEDSDCQEDYHTDYCFNGDLYRKKHDFSCINGICSENVSTEIIEECENGCKNGDCLDDEDECDDEDDEEDDNYCESCPNYEEILYLNLMDNNKQETGTLNLKDDIAILGKKPAVSNMNNWVIYLAIGVGALILIILISIIAKK